MGVPFEALLPYGIVVAMFGVTGVGLSVVKTFANDGKKARWNRDLWDRQMMERDLRLTGSLRGQSTNVEAPKGFELNNPWKVEKRLF
ncbi:NADH dehydrogenase [ubiquinone] 1 alpha subcomplex subunit 1 [Aspergillus undulatus]|uniref:NADH dehydrogenase [ubiquinone] 1 alpha subcomplex subunit 1 n=1 Tax=Aspergillus undulatus TaxID=1810928 RepID=UPI003CCCC52F